MKPVRILMLGDIVGRPGRTFCIERVRMWRNAHQIDVVIANGENASGGNGLTVRNAGELFESGIDLITGGNHIWKQKDFPPPVQNISACGPTGELSRRSPRIGLDDIPGAGAKIAVLNLQGQVFMEPVDNPFRAADSLLDKIRAETPVIIVDFHAEASSERVAMGLHLDGKVSAVVGTHTHIASADQRILPRGTAYKSDLGMVGPIGGVLGVDSEAILTRFLTGLPARFTVAKGEVEATGAIIVVDAETGRAISIEQFSDGS